MFVRVAPYSDYGEIWESVFPFPIARGNQMSLWFDVARVAAGLNILLLAVLLFVWGRNYLDLRSKHALGLMVFAVLLLLENAVALYIYSLDPTLSVWFASAVPPIAWRGLMSLHVLETVGIGFLVWITMD